MDAISIWTKKSHHMVSHIPPQQSYWYRKDLLRSLSYLTKLKQYKEISSQLSSSKCVQVHFCQAIKVVDVVWHVFPTTRVARWHFTTQPHNTMTTRPLGTSTLLEFEHLPLNTISIWTKGERTPHLPYPPTTSYNFQKDQEIPSRLLSSNCLQASAWICCTNVLHMRHFGCRTGSCCTACSGDDFLHASTSQHSAHNTSASTPLGTSSTFWNLNAVCGACFSSELKEHTTLSHIPPHDTGTDGSVENFHI